VPVSLRTRQKLRVHQTHETHEVAEQRSFEDYLLARCPSNDQQLMYIEERMEDILDLKQDILCEDITIVDRMRIFKGDKPASQFESGQQKNGDYFCWQCPMYAKLSSNLVYTLSLPNISLPERIEKIVLTTT